MRRSLLVRVGVVAVLLPALGGLASVAQAFGPATAERGTSKEAPDRVPAAGRNVLRQARFRLSGDKPGDTCAAATNEIGPLPFNAVGSTVGLGDDLNISGCGVSSTGPDIVYRLRVDNACSLLVAMFPQSLVDLNLYVVTDCANPSGTCIAGSDIGFEGEPEFMQFDATPGIDYFVVVDDHGDEGIFDLEIADVNGSGCDLVPVELDSFTIE